MSAVSRRALVRGALLGGLAVAAPGLRPAGAGAQITADGTYLRSLVALEVRMAEAYAGALRVPRLTRSTRDLLRTLHRHETEHVAAMTTLIEQVGAPPPEALSHHATLTGLSEALAAARGERAILTLASELEANALAAYANAVQGMQDARTLETAGAVMASEAQHQVALRLALGRDPLPGPFDGGVGDGRRG